jgi:hypothetical protein
VAEAKRQAEAEKGKKILAPQITPTTMLAFSPRVQIKSSRVSRSGVLDNLLSILQLHVSLVANLVGQLASLDPQLLSLGLSLSGRVVDLFTDRRNGESGREEGVGVVRSRSHFVSGVWGVSVLNRKIQ